MGSVFTGWWSWLVAIWAVVLLAISVFAALGVGVEGDEGVERVVFALAFLGFAALTATALVVRHKAPRLAAWLLVVGVGPMALPGGSGSVWMLIPTAIALVIIIGGLATGEIRFTRPQQPDTE